MRVFLAASQLVSEADTDPLETKEWLESLTSVVAEAGEERGRLLL